MWAVAQDPATGFSRIIEAQVRTRYIDGVTFSVTGGAFYFTTEEGQRWCRDDPEDIAALNALVTLT